MKTAGLISLIFLATAIVGCTGARLKFTPQAEILISADQAKNEGDLATYFAKIKKLAQGGDPYAADRLAMRYQWGTGIQQDYRQADTWYRIAANRGVRGAKYYLNFVDIRGWPNTSFQEVEWLQQDAPFAPVDLVMTGHRGVANRVVDLDDVGPELGQGPAQGGTG